MSDTQETKSRLENGNEMEEIDTLEFHFIKSNHFRVIHVDGAWGGLTPRGDLRVVIYNERSAIPTKTFHRITDEGGLGSEIPELREGKKGGVRELEADLVMSLGVAQGLYEWLGAKLSEAQKLLQEAGEDS